jgi:hypothetical protein
MRFKRYGFGPLDPIFSSLYTSATKGVVIRQGAIPAFFWPTKSCGANLCTTNPAQLFMAPESPNRPPWLNWLFLLAFLWSSYQLAGLWFARLHG